MCQRCMWLPMVSCVLDKRLTVLWWWRWLHMVQLYWWNRIKAIKYNVNWWVFPKKVWHVVRLLQAEAMTHFFQLFHSFCSKKQNHISIFNSVEVSSALLKTPPSFLPFSLCPFWKKCFSSSVWNVDNQWQHQLVTFISSFILLDVDVERNVGGGGLTNVAIWMRFCAVIVRPPPFHSPRPRPLLHYGLGRPTVNPSHFLLSIDDYFDFARFLRTHSD